MLKQCKLSIQYVYNPNVYQLDSFHVKNIRNYNIYTSSKTCHMYSAPLHVANLQMDKMCYEYSIRHTTLQHLGSLCNLLLFWSRLVHALVDCKWTNGATATCDHLWTWSSCCSFATKMYTDTMASPFALLNVRVFGYLMNDVKWCMYGAA